MVCRMPYILVETTDAVGNKELIAAPETWLERDEEGTRAFLCWPNVRNITTLNALLTDAGSIPSSEWDKHSCVVKCSNIQSLAIAGKMIETLQKHWKEYGNGGVSKRTTLANGVDEGPSHRLTKFKTEEDDWDRLQTSVPEVNQTEHQIDDELDEAQLIEMFTELTRKVERSHDEVRKQLYDGFRRVEKNLQEFSLEPPPATREPRSAWSLSNNAFEFHVNPITCIEEMNDFEERLNDIEYRTQVHHWIVWSIGDESHPVKRMVEILDSLIDIEFLSKFSWTGRSQTGKFALREYTNLIDLFQYAGTTRTNLATPRFVARFFIQKLNYLSVASTIEELDTFEEQLNDPEIRSRVYRWASETISYEADPESRMMEILDLLYNMPYALVETVDAAGDTKLLAVPELWVVACQTAGIDYLHWPDAKSLRNIKTLLADEHSCPAASWEKHKCTVIYRDVASMLVARQTLQIIQKHRKAQEIADTANNVTNVEMNTDRNDPPTIELPKHVEAYQPSVSVQVGSYTTSTVEQDPFSDIAPAPPLMQQVPINQGGCQKLSFLTREQDNDPFEDLSSFVDPFPQNLISVMGLLQNEPPSRDSVTTAVGENQFGSREVLHSSKEAESEPIGDVKLFSQLYVLFDELKCMIKANQEEIRQKLTEGFSQMQTTFRSWTEQNTHLKSNKPNSYALDEYQVYGLASIEEVISFDERLKDAVFRQEVHKWVNCLVSDVEGSWNRMKKMMNLIFDKKLIIKLSWTGAGGTKYPLRDYLNILNLFKFIGTTSTHRMLDAEVRVFFIKHIKYTKNKAFNYHAQMALKKKNARLRTIEPSLSMSVEDECDYETTMEQDDGVSERAETTEQNENTVPQDSVIELEQQEHSSMEDSLQNEYEGNPPYNHVFRLKTIDELNAFEAKLYDKRKLKDMKLWIDLNLQHDFDVEYRMKTLLERLVDKHVLLNFTWNSTDSGKLSLAQYKNVVGLFYYATEIGNIVKEQGCVPNFFMKVLDHVSKDKRAL
uniref:DUF4806 domain-containing protein n=1 Tax=Anopheles christyi TaxID=43041 RepID=A0A182JS26_9DIPT